MAAEWLAKTGATYRANKGSGTQIRNGISLMTILYIIGILFLALVIIVPLLEKSKWRMSGEDMSKLTRWFWPLLMILLVAQLIKMLVT
jgi:phosphoglycerol transferase MdoB-like AlkP superfamily enzyme